MLQNTERAIQKKKKGGGAIQRNWQHRVHYIRSSDSETQNKIKHLITNFKNCETALYIAPLIKNIYIHI